MVEITLSQAIYKQKGGIHHPENIWQSPKVPHRFQWLPQGHPSNEHLGMFMSNTQTLHEMTNS